MNVNTKGSIGEALMLADLTKAGYHVFKPFSDHVSVDFIVANAVKHLVRLQVKYRQIERGKIILPLHSVVNGKKAAVDLTLMDAWAIYNPDHDTILYVTKADLRRGGFSARIVAPHRSNRQALPVQNLGPYANPHRLFTEGGQDGNAADC